MKSESLLLDIKKLPGLLQIAAVLLLSINGSLALAQPGQAAPAEYGRLRDMSPEQRREALKNMSPEQRQRVREIREERRAERGSQANPGDSAGAERREARQNNRQGMSPEERRALRRDLREAGRDVYRSRR